MSDYSAISAVSESLRSILDASLTSLLGAGQVKVTDLLDDFAPSGTMLTLFLYDVSEDPSARNRPPSRQVVGTEILLKKPPLALILRYMFTPWGGTPETTQKILGRVMQVMHEDAILGSEVLVDSLRRSGTALKVTMAPISLEDRTRIWNSLHKPYRLSLTYEVRVVNIDAQRGTPIAPVRAGFFESGEKGDGP